MQIEVDIAIARSLHEVFEAIVDPQQMSRYFISRSSGRPEPGATLTWTWEDVGADGMIKVLDVQADRRFAFRWPAEGDGTEVSIELLDEGNGRTAVMVREGPFEVSEAGTQEYGAKTFGWAHFLMCLKAWVEYGIDLRKGSITRRHLQQIKGAAPARR